MAAPVRLARLTSENGELTEARYDGVMVQVLNPPSKDSLYVEVKPFENKCPLTTGNLFVLKRCLRPFKQVKM